MRIIIDLLKSADSAQHCFVGETSGIVLRGELPAEIDKWDSVANMCDCKHFYFSFLSL